MRRARRYGDIRKTLLSMPAVGMPTAACRYRPVRRTGSPSCRSFKRVGRRVVRPGQQRHEVDPRDRRRARGPALGPDCRRQRPRRARGPRRPHGPARDESWRLSTSGWRGVEVAFGKVDQRLLTIERVVRCRRPATSQRRITPTTLTPLRPRPNARTTRIPSPDLQSPDVDAAWRPGGGFRRGAACATQTAPAPRWVRRGD